MQNFIFCAVFCLEQMVKRIFNTIKALKGKHNMKDKSNEKTSSRDSDGKRRRRAKSYLKDW